MTTRSFRMLLGLPLLMLPAVLALPDTTAAQVPWPGQESQATQPPPSTQPQRSRPRAVAPVVGEEDELSPRQMQQAPGRQQTQPARRTPAAPAAEPGATGATAVPSAAPRAAQPAARSIACSGVFARDLLISSSPSPSTRAI